MKSFLAALQRKIFFNLFYLRKPPWDTGISPPELMSFIQNHPPGRALDLGCGTGTNGITLAKHGWQVTGIDFVARAIREARQKAVRQGVQADFHVGDVTRLEGIQGPFDLILDIGCFHSLSQQGRASYLENLDRLLAVNGTFLMYAFFKEDSQPSASGLEAADLELLSSRLALKERQDGTDRGRRASAWFTYQRKPDEGAAA